MVYLPIKLSKVYLDLYKMLATFKYLNKFIKNIYLMIVIIYYKY